MAQPRRVMIVAYFAGAASLMAALARAEPVAWPDDFMTRVEALALVQTLNAEILASRSATLTLEKWCGEHHLAGAAEAKIVAHLVRGDAKPATPEQRQRLEVGPDEPLKYRRVQLLCGDQVLSEADNWYVPSRLTAEMNQVLETTDTPFGKAVLALQPYRQTFAANVLWWPLADGWETKLPSTDPASQTMALPQALFEHQAILYTKDRKPFSEVHEVYQRQLLAFPLPHP